MTGTLYIVATPIGNLEDITLRALRILKECDAIACEDTRQTRKLLDHYAISKAVISYHEHNERERAGELAEKMAGGENIALVTDAGTPLVSDPGYRLVQAAIEHGVTVVPIPGPSAAIGALSASGLATDSFRFGGFLPPKSMQRRKVLEAGKYESGTLVFYETPHRILEALEDIAAVMPNRPVVVARELTKMHEEFLRGTAAEIHAQLAARPTVRGEITLLIGKSERPEADTSVPVEDAVLAHEKQGLPRMDAIKQVAKERGLNKRDVYRLMAEAPKRK
ncbi:MAG: 16S rRNA (cytidine(1402)-2'-O)-methyltransferase [Bryobacteraceae bacterium]